MAGSEELDCGEVRGLPSLWEVSKHLRSGELTSVEVTGWCLANAEARADTLGTFLFRHDEVALEYAAAADRAAAAGQRRGALHGVPLALKDNIFTSDMPTTAQSRVLRRDHPGRRIDAEAVARLREAGAVLVGKTSMIEFARGEIELDGPFPVPRNPWSLDRWAGGSSSGMASGLVAGMFLGGLGTDTGGSIRLPATYCGITGLSPSAGRVSDQGVIPVARSLDRVGPMARSARDCAVLLAAVQASPATAIAREDHRLLEQMLREEPSLEAVRGVRIGVDPALGAGEGPDGEAIPADIRRAYRAALAVLGDLGAELVDVDLGELHELNVASEIVISAEALAFHRRSLQARWDDYGVGTRRTIAIGATYSAADLVAAQQAVARAKERFRRRFESIDLLVTPTSAGVAPVLGGTAPKPALGRSHFLRAWNLLGNPAVSVPMGLSAEGLPVGLQLVGRHEQDAFLLRCAEGFQQATDWHLARPARTGTASAAG